MSLRHTASRSTVSFGRSAAGRRPAARIARHLPANRSKSGSPPVPSVIKGSLESLESLRSLLTSALVVILMIASLLIVYRATTANVFTVEALSLPSDLSKQGWSGELLAQALADNLQRKYREALTSGEGFEFPAVTSQWSQADFQVPGAGVSIQAVAQQLRALLGLPEKRTRGVITYDEHGWGMGMYDSNGRIQWVRPEPNTSGNKEPAPFGDVIDELLDRSVVSLLLKTDPYVLAVAYFNEEKDECKGRRRMSAEGIACKFENTQNVIHHVLDRHDSEDHRWALALQARLLQEKGEFESAIQAYELGQVLYPTFAPNFFNEGYAYFVHNQYDKAIPLLRRAVELNGSDASSRYYLAKALAERNSTGEAARHLHEVIGLGKGMEPLARMELGIIHHRQGNYSGATDELRKSAQLLPRNPDPFIVYGCSLLDQGRSQEAARMFFAALEKQRGLAALYGPDKVEGELYGPEKVEEGLYKVERSIIARLIASHTMASRKPDEKASQRGIFDTCIPVSESQLWTEAYIGH